MISKYSLEILERKMNTKMSTPSVAISDTNFVCDCAKLKEEAEAAVEAALKSLSDKYTKMYKGKYLALNRACGWKIDGKITRVEVYQVSHTKSSYISTNMLIFHKKVDKNGKEKDDKEVRYTLTDGYDARIFSNFDMVKLVVELNGADALQDSEMLEAIEKE